MFRRGSEVPERSRTNFWRGSGARFGEVAERGSERFRSELPERFRSEVPERFRSEVLKRPVPERFQRGSGARFRKGSGANIRRDSGARFRSQGQRGASEVPERFRSEVLERFRRFRGVITLERRFQKVSGARFRKLRSKVPEQGSGSRKVPERGSGKVPEQGSGEVPERGFRSKLPERFRRGCGAGSGVRLRRHSGARSGEVPE